MQNRGLVIAGLALGAAVISAATPAFAADDVSKEISDLKTRLADLEKKESANWLTEERKNEIKQIVTQVIEDAKTRNTAGVVNAGYKDGFFITDGQNFNLVIGGFIQPRYSYARHNEPFASRQVGTAGGGNPAVTPNGAGDATGFEIRRARISFSGFIINKDVTFKMEGDFYAGSSGSGGFTVTDAFVAYKYNDLLRVKAGSFKVPFAKTELVSDTNLGLMERPEVLAPFDPVRALGLSVYGDFIKDQLAYEVNVNDGARSSLLKGVDAYATSTGGARPTANLDNRLSFYARIQWAGAGKISDFADEPDLRSGDRPFVWLLGAAAGYESQNSTNNAFPSPQGSITSPGQSTNTAPGFLGTQTLNGDLFRGTVDWSAKYAGWSFITSAYIQQFNYNQGATSSTNGGTSSVGGGYGVGDSSFFTWGAYGQVGYMVTDKLELVGRAGILATEGYPNIGEFYTIGANYYFAKHNSKIMADIGYSPEAAYSDSNTGLLVNTHSISFRLQYQLKF
jgi:hypothetical protein